MGPRLLAISSAINSNSKLYLLLLNTANNKLLLFAINNL